MLGRDENHSDPNSNAGCFNVGSGIDAVTRNTCAESGRWLGKGTVVGLTVKNGTEKWDGLTVKNGTYCEKMGLNVKNGT